MLIIAINAQSHYVDAPSPWFGGGDHLCPYGRKLIGSLVPVHSRSVQSNTRNIVEKARKNLLQERIRLTNQKISQLQDKKRCLAERFPSDVQQQLNAHLTRVHESVHKQAKGRQQDKFASLISKSKKNNPSEPDLSGTQIKRWVVNLSKYKLNQDQTNVLSKGLNFAITPQATRLRTEIVRAIKSSKVPKSNISKGGKNGPSVTETGGFHHDTASRQGKSHSSHG